MSVFAHHPFYPNNYGNFGGLVRFLDDWDKHFSQHGRNVRLAHHPRHGRGNVPSFTPRFDLSETEQNYQLHGELPGIEKKDINIEFTDSQTIVIRGSIERSYAEGNPPVGTLDPATSSEAIADKPHGEDTESFHATVEDDYEDLEPNAPGSPVAESSARAENAPEESHHERSSEGRSKFWIYERSIGNFSRTFTFSSLVDHDNVSASLENGILTVVVPKARKPDSRRINIQ